MKNPSLKYFRWAFLVTAAGLVLSFVLGWMTYGTLNGALSFLFICAVLSVLEISLSFDNAIVNANVLKRMQPIWQKRFLTWGILIAVFGMRILFPVAVVAIAARIGPFAAVHLAATDPQAYAQIMDDAHLGIAAFGGTFLMMVALNYFVDEAKDVDWFKMLEKRLRQCASIRGLEITFVLAIIVSFAMVLPEQENITFVLAALFGLITFTVVETAGKILDRADAAADAARAGGLGAFLYLEMLDASFSFDGVIGAFALTQNMFLIAIGLGVGAMYVRSMTIMIVERETLAQFRYLEHGAFYSIFVLSMIMFAQTIVHIPELITGLLGACLIGVALWSSVRYNRKIAC
ncbi:MAG: DUF475 domain-containing protein [Marinosulfonomonas sp.]